VPISVALDTNIVIWGIRKEASIGDEICALKAQHLIETLEKNKCLIFIPSIVAAEAGVKVPVEKRMLFFSMLAERFMILPFDGKASAIYPGLREAGLQAQQIEGLQLVPDYGRKAYNADCMVLATVMARNVGVLYTLDKRLTRLAAGRVEVKGLPDIPPKMIELPMGPDEASVD